MAVSTRATNRETEGIAHPAPQPTTFTKTKKKFQKTVAKPKKKVKKTIKAKMMKVKKVIKTKMVNVKKIIKKIIKKMTMKAPKKKKPARDINMLNFFLAVIGGRKTPSLHDPPIILGGEPRSVTHPFQCPICVMSMTCERTLKDHFVKCAPLNGNPFGFYCYQGTGFDTAKDVRSAKAMNEEA